jgi:hypothetical protein
MSQDVTAEISDGDRFVDNASTSSQETWFDFAAFSNKSFRQKGFHSCPLSEIVDQCNTKDGIKLLARRHVESKKTCADQESRFNIHFIARQFGFRGEQDSGMWEVLEHLYGVDLQPELSVNIKRDQSENYTPDEIIKNAIANDSVIHVVITASENGKNKDGVVVQKKVAIGAMSFCPHQVDHNSLFLCLCAVSSNSYARKVYGRKADGQPWRMRGFASFLLSVCKKLHRSIHHYSGSLSVFVCLRESYTFTPFFKHLHFMPTAYNFKDCFGSGYLENGTGMKNQGGMDHVPFIAEGIVYGNIGKSQRLVVTCDGCFPLTLSIPRIRDRE